MQKTLVLTSLSLATLLCGCASISKLGPAATQATVDGIAGLAIQQDHNILPYLKAVQPIICQAANGGSVDPLDIVLNLQNSSANELKTPTGELAINAVLAVYEGIYYAYGTNIQSSVVQPYLQATCSGLTMAIGSKIVAPTIMLVAPVYPSMSWQAWPRVR